MAVIDSNQYYVYSNLNLKWEHKEVKTQNSNGDRGIMMFIKKR